MAARAPRAPGTDLDWSSTSPLTSAFRRSPLSPGALQGPSTRSDSRSGLVWDGKSRRMVAEWENGMGGNTHR